MFVRITGFGTSSGVELPVYLRNPISNSKSVVFAVIRWMSPHPNANERDRELRPVCPSPFEINHALWRFTTVSRPRAAMDRRNVENQLSIFQGSTDGEKRQHAMSLSRAMYDLVQIQSIDRFINCTTIDNDVNTILETVTLPFV